MKMKIDVSSRSPFPFFFCWPKDTARPSGGAEGRAVGDLVTRCQRRRQAFVQSHPLVQRASSGARPQMPSAAAAPHPLVVLGRATRRPGIGPATCPP